MNKQTNRDKVYGELGWDPFTKGEGIGLPRGYPVDFFLFHEFTHCILYWVKVPSVSFLIHEPM